MRLTAPALPVKMAVAGDPGRVHGGLDGPAVAGEIDAIVAVPGPGTVDQQKARTAVSEARLQYLPRVAGDQVGGGGRVAVVDDSYLHVAVALVFGAQGGVEVVQRAAAVVQIVSVGLWIGGHHRSQSAGDVPHRRMRHRQRLRSARHRNWHDGQPRRRAVREGDDRRQRRTQVRAIAATGREVDAGQHGREDHQPTERIEGKLVQFAHQKLP